MNFTIGTFGAPTDAGSSTGHRLLFVCCDRVSTPEEIALHYYESLNETGHTSLSTQRSVNNYGVGLKFMDFIDLRNPEFNIQIKSSVNKAYQFYMFFTSILSM